MPESNEISTIQRAKSLAVSLTILTIGTVAMVAAYERWIEAYLMQVPHIPWYVEWGGITIFWAWLLYIVFIWGPRGGLPPVR